MIVDFVLNPSFFDPAAFLTSAGKGTKILDPADLQKRVVDITYVRFRCMMNGSSVDARIVNLSDLTFHICLRLPQHPYDDVTGVVQLINRAPSIPVSTSSIARSLGSCFAASGGSIGVNTPPKRNAPLTTGSAFPAMTRFLSSQKPTSGTRY